MEMLWLSYICGLLWEIHGYEVCGTRGTGLYFGDKMY